MIRRDGDGEQRLLVPVSTMIPVSYDRLPLAGRPLAAQQGFYLGGQIAQLRLRLLCSRSNLQWD